MLKPHDTFIRAGTLLEQYEGRGKIDEIKRGGTRRDKSGEAMPSGEAKPRAALLCRHDETISSYSSGSERRSGPAINIPRPSAAPQNGLWRGRDGPAARRNPGAPVGIVTLLITGQGFFLIV